MCLDSEKRINTGNDDHPEDANDNHLDSRWPNHNGHVGNGHVGNGRVGNGHVASEYVAPEITKNPIELFASPDHLAASAETNQMQNSPKVGYGCQSWSLVVDG